MPYADFVLTIRQEQMHIFDRLGQGAFVLEMEAHLRKPFPATTQGLSAEAMQDHIRRAIARTGEFGLLSKQDVCRLLNLFAFLGWDMFEQPGNEWMLEIMHAASGMSPSDRLKRLRDQILYRQALLATTLRAVRECTSCHRT